MARQIKETNEKPATNNRMTDKGKRSRVWGGKVESGNDSVEWERR